LGEDWAEKVAAELCELLGLPYAAYELASTWQGNRGVVSPNFLPAVVANEKQIHSPFFLV